MGRFKISDDKRFTEGEDGWCYINGGYKKDRRSCFQQYEFWTGLEYAFAVFLYIENMLASSFIK